MFRWDIFSNKLLKVVQDVYVDHWKVGELNKTLITLIPIIDEVLNMKQFMPLGLCNVS